MLLNMEPGEKTLYRLVNAPFDFEFMGQKYQVRRASLDKAVQYQQRARELQASNDPAADLKLLAYCIYLVLKDKIPDLTEELVFANTPADIDIIECMSMLGFIDPRKAALAKQLQESVLNRWTTKDSSVSSPTEQDGHLEK
jgi:hypothetical protein